MYEILKEVPELDNKMLERLMEAKSVFGKL